MKTKKLTKKSVDGWEYVGAIGVDAGIMYLGDPCYILQDRNETPNYEEFISDKVMEDVNKKGAGIYKNFVGAVCSTGFGDGSYDVFIKKYKAGKWGTRVAEMKVVFIGEDEKGEWEN